MNPLLLLAALLAGALLLALLAARLARSSPDGGLNTWSRFLLICLRLTIGWHFLVEGLDKLHTPTWSSEVYLREAAGPLAPKFRELAGDRLVDKLTVGADNSFPAELNDEWSAYLDAFSDFYQLNEDYRKKAKAVSDQAKSRTLTWMTSVKQPVSITAAYPPPYTHEMTVAERLKRHEVLEGRVRELEADIPRYGKEVHAKFRSAKTDLAKWRADLKRDLDQHFQDFKKDLREGVLTPLLQDTAPPIYRGKLTTIEYRENLAALAASTVGLSCPLLDHGSRAALTCLMPERFHEFGFIVGRAKEKEWLMSVEAIHHQIQLRNASNDDMTLDPIADKIFQNAFAKRQGEQRGDELLPYTPRRPLRTWTLLDWSDALVKYGLVAVGGCLIAGLFTRTACLAGAGFLLMFFLAMPPLPGWPDSPRAEGHYLYINKNIIEMVALLALATMRTGRWAGLDGVLAALRGWRGRGTSGRV